LVIKGKTVPKLERSANPFKLEPNSRGYVQQ